MALWLSSGLFRFADDAARGVRIARSPSCRAGSTRPDLGPGKYSRQRFVQTANPRRLLRLNPKTPRRSWRELLARHAPRGLLAHHSGKRYPKESLLSPQAGLN